MSKPAAPAQSSEAKIQPALPGGADIRVYEYGVRLDAQSVDAANDQIMRSRRLYNELIAAIVQVTGDQQSWMLERAGDEARAVSVRLNLLNEEFAQARADNDEAAMKRVALERRTAWRTLAQALAAVRREHVADLRTLFYSRIGKNSNTDTYKLRCKAVAEGLGWATANRCLDRALAAYKASMKMGRAPRFARGSEILQDSLTLQFTEAGGVAAERLLDGSHGDLRLRPPASAARRAYGELSFRLGPAVAGVYATGTWQYHRPLPHGASVALATLVRRRVANKFKWAVQLTVRAPNQQCAPGAPRRTLAAVHMGWAVDDTGRQVAGIAADADPGLARLIHLPEDVERDLQTAQEIQGARDKARDEAVEALKAIDGSVIDALSEDDKVFFAGLKRLRPQHIAARKFYVAQTILRKAGANPGWLDKWVAEDRKAWQATVGIARRARARRRHFYREVANELARTHSAVVIETLDLAKAAVKIDRDTGERSEFSAAARRGRQVAALFELDQLIAAACINHGTALFRMAGERTVADCAVCGSSDVRPVEGAPRETECTACGARGDRKLMGAARAWQLCSKGIEDHIVDYHVSVRATRAAGTVAKAEKAARLVDARRRARERSDGESELHEANRCGG